MTKFPLLYIFNAFKEYGNFVTRYDVVMLSIRVCLQMFDISLLLLAVFEEFLFNTSVALA